MNGTVAKHLRWMEQELQSLRQELADARARQRKSEAEADRLRQVIVELKKQLDE